MKLEIAESSYLREVKARTKTLARLDAFTIYFTESQSYDEAIAELWLTREELISLIKTLKSLLLSANNMPDYNSAHAIPKSSNGKLID